MADFGIQPRWQLPSGIQARVTTVAEPGNLAVHVGDDPAQVLLHRRQLQRHLGLVRPPKWLAQFHSTEVVAEEHSETGARADAIWASRAHSSCAVLTADCLPILLCSEDGSTIAAIHAGWRGLAAGIVGKTLKQLPQAREQFRAYIGPAISQPHFEVGDEVREAFAALSVVDSSTFQSHRPGKWLANLPLLAERLLAAERVANVTQSHFCTYSDERFFSYRRDPTCGRIATLIWKV